MTMREGDKSKVVISNRWHNSPGITAYVTSEEVGVIMALDDFVETLAAAIGNPTLLITKAQLLAALKLAQAAVESEMKLATIQVV